VKAQRQHPHSGGLAAGAVLGDLAGREQDRWAGLRERCPQCQVLERDLDRVLADLALAVPRHLPPPSVLEGIRAAIHAHADRA
jgi:hypothetical protein